MKLYDIPKEFTELEQILIDTAGELTPELEARLDAFLRQGKDKIEAAAMVLRGFEAEADACRAEATRLAERAASLERNAERLEKLVLPALDAAFAGKVKTTLFTIWGQTSAATEQIDLAPDADLAEMEKSTPQFVRVKRELDKAALKQARKEGKTLPTGVIVCYVPGTRFLQIR